MDDKRDIEAWADALLAEHRTPRPERPAPDTPTDELPPMLKLQRRLTGVDPDPELVERYRRVGKWAKPLRKYDAPVQLIYVALLIFAAFAMSAGF